MAMVLIMATNLHHLFIAAMVRSYALFPYGHPTPDGYSLVESNWASSGQMSRRFEIARAIGAGNAGLFDPEDGSAAKLTGFPQLSSKLYYAAVEPFLAVGTRDALNRATSQQEWNTFLLSSPEFVYD